MDDHTKEGFASRDRRRAKDRRQYVDPRYRSPAFPEFVDRRRGQRRRPVYEDPCHLIREHPARRWVTRIGFVVVLLFMYLLLFTNLLVFKRVGEGADRKCTITLGLIAPHGGSDSPTFSV
jgi:hypothetical protein